MTEQRIELTTVQPDDPTLAVKLQAKPPVVGKNYQDQPKHGVWTLDLMERTLFEFRAAGGWDGAVVSINNGGWNEGGSLTCEVLAVRGDAALPWGWRPSQGKPPAPDRSAPAPGPVVPDSTGVLGRVADLVGSRVLHGVLLLVLVALVVAL